MQVITVANNKGGVGKTMQCYQLASYLASKGHRVLAVDLDSQANLSTTVGIQIRRTLIPEWLIGDVDFDDVVVPAESEYEFAQNLWIIPSSRHLANFAKLLILSDGEIRKNAGRKERLLRMRLEAARERFDYVIIDTPPMLGDELIMALVASDMVLIPTQAQDFSIDGLEELMDTFEIIKDTENPNLKFSIIPSMVNLNRKIERQRLEELSESFEETEVTPPIRSLVQIQESVALRKPIFLWGKSSKARADYEELWKTLNIE